MDTKDTFTIPPSSAPSIGRVLLAAGVSFRSFGEGWTQYVANPSSPTSVYCNICHPFQYQTFFMTNPALRTTVNKDASDLYADLQNDTLPAVAFVKPSGSNDGHPVSSKFSIFEAFVRKILTEPCQKPDLSNSTAIFFTVDESGGYNDSGCIQPLDFVGDGPRIPLAVVSRWATGGYVDHSYADHTSLVKIIEANWKLSTISNRSRDNLPNPVASAADPCVPTNRPAIDNLLDVFHFNH